ncbi:TetR/AcrR family transcriptional regulator [Leptospira mayottensis]|uniref:Transcriptional regulator, TetR family n=2 Tax=Leptospira mayottensis TaxID=1137606 RepID=A0AA87MQI1_9LEPT|nr:TetR/AcrR family transcriptional regulator [Leptospira mayottensis]AXR59733.1 TetR/AcrR family transcriptional regulator [Leptospira mayottensis]AXR64019.1 TetR/AcrR family transcriptional regulator [Leptospira mayottensis]AZQ00947.1 TetR/AcrR family transcriptional regulator [Leptospira mayottensis 200901116]EKS00506.1 transcriptional regulator, TetR family [Leptospira mayottensis 200901122]TGN11829.1 TetR/AcrR family transcriptional regulator [Leptospira mayottensis]
MRSGGDTKEKIVTIARDYFQSVGFRSFSFQDIANDLGIKKASIHYYYPSKEELGLEILEAYDKDFKKYIENIRERSPRVRLFGLFKLYVSYAGENGNICPFGVVGTEYHVLSQTIRDKTLILQDQHRDFLIQTLYDGVKDGSFLLTLSVRDTADLFISAIQGAMQISRIRKDKEYFPKMIQSLKSMIQMKEHKNAGF